MIFVRNTMRSAFSMITAIFIILLMATVAGFIMNLTGKMVKETTTQYQKEQAILYAKSYTEYAIMAATPRDCIERIDAFIGDSVNDVNSGDGYDVRVDIQYVGTDLVGGACNTIGASPITHPQSKGAIMLIDTYVRYRDRDTVAAFVNSGGVVDANNLPWLTYHRRTLQRL